MRLWGDDERPHWDPVPAFVSCVLIYVLFALAWQVIR